MEYIRLAVRVTTLILITVLTIAFGMIYKKKKANSISLTHRSTDSSQLPNRNLMLNVHLCQSIILLITFLPLIYGYLNYYMLIPQRTGLTGEPLNQYILFLDAFVILAPTCNFVFYIILSKSFRNSAQKLFTSCFVKVSPTISS